MRVSLLTRAGVAAAAAVIATAGAMATAGAAGAAAGPRKPTPKPTYSYFETRPAVQHHEHVTVTPGAPSRTTLPQKLTQRPNTALARKRAHHSSPAARQATHLSIGTKAAIEHHRHVTVIAGRLTAGGAGLAGRVIFLDRVTATAGLVVVDRERTSRTGDVAFVVSPEVTTHYLLVFLGSSRLRGSRSLVVMVKD
jgi:hypothetical protein